MSTKTHIQEFIESGKLEQYVIGASSDSDRAVIYQMIQEHPEIAVAYEKAQRDLLIHATAHQVELKPEVRKKLLSKVIPNSAVPRNRDVYNRSWFNSKLGIAAAIIVLLCSSGLVYFTVQNTILRDQLAADEEKIQRLDTELSEIEKENRNLTTEKENITSVNTDKYVLRSTDNSVIATVYHGKTREFAEIIIDYIQPLDENHDYQLWADIEGEMISLAVIDPTAKKIDLNSKLLSQAESINLTIEPAGGSDHATVENLVANVMIPSGS